MEPLDVMRAMIEMHSAPVTEASTPSAALAALGELEASCRKARERVAVHAVLDLGWTYAQLGRALRITRQAAVKTYGPVVEATLRRRLRAAAR
jgi:hypothetical protein